MLKPTAIGRDVTHLIEDRKHDEINEILHDEGLLGVMRGSIRDLFDVTADPDEALEAGPTFKLGYVKHGENVDVSSRFVKASISMNEKFVKDIKDYVPQIGISIEVDHEKILIEGEGHEYTDDEAILKVSRRGLGSRTFYPSIHFESLEEANAYFDAVSDVFEGLIEEFGARGHQLIDGDLVRSEEASSQKYDEALQRAVKLTNIEFGFTKGTGRYSTVALAEEVINYADVPFHRETIKNDETGKLVTHYIFGPSVGEFCFYDNEDGEPQFAHWTYPTKDGAGSLKEHYHGPVTKEALCEHFVRWLADVGRERGTINEADYDILHEGEGYELLSKIRQPTEEVGELREIDPEANKGVHIITPTEEEIRYFSDPTVHSHNFKPK